MSLAIATMALAGLAACSPQELGPSPAGLEQARLTIHSGDRRHKFVVEVARTPQEQARGLMFRQSLAPDRGMLFPYDPPQPASFWMKDTLIPLDIIFIGPDRRISGIAANTVPLSLESVPAPGPVSAVLEIAGGRSAELGITAGDTVEWPQTSALR